MTPEQAAEQAAHVLKQAAAWADKPETVSGFVQIADAWTRLHTALKAGQGQPVTVNMSDAVVKDPDLKKLGKEFSKRFYGYALGEPEPIRIPARFHLVGDEDGCVDLQCRDCSEGGQALAYYDPHTSRSYSIAATSSIVHVTTIGGLIDVAMHHEMHFH